MTTQPGMSDSRIDGTQAWWVASACLVMMSISFGAPFVSSVALKQIALELGGQRSVPAAAMSLAWLGTGIGGLGMSWLAKRIGILWTVCGGILMMGLGLLLSTGGQPWQLWVGHGLFIGLLGNAGLNAPLFVYLSNWFEARRGTALSLISSGPYVAGALWPPIFERAVTAFGWRATMIGFGVFSAAIVIPLAFVFLSKPPLEHEDTAAHQGEDRGQLFGLPANLVFALLMVAAFLCCIPMALPSSHLIAFCGDLGISASHGALALSLLLTCAFFSRQFWGWMSDTYGGLPTLITCSTAQAVATAGFLFTQSEAGLFAVAAAFGLGFSGLIPAYILTVRHYFPASEAYWRVPMFFVTGMSGMAAGSWLGGLIYDQAGSYTPAFATGLLANALNLAILLILLVAWRRQRPLASTATSMILRIPS